MMRNMSTRKGLDDAARVGIGFKMFSGWPEEMGMCDYPFIFLTSFTPLSLSISLLVAHSFVHFLFLIISPSLLFTLFLTYTLLSQNSISSSALGSIVGLQSAAIAQLSGQYAAEAAQRASADNERADGLAAHKVERERGVQKGQKNGRRKWKVRDGGRIWKETPKK